MNIKNVYFGVLLALSAAFTPGIATAQGQHPYCIYALNDLLAAREMLQGHIAGNAMTHNEKEALRQINVIIREINDAAVVAGGKRPTIPTRAKVATNQDDATILHRCIDLLAKAKDELGQESDAQFADGLRDRSIKNCDEAIKFVGRIKHS